MRLAITLVYILLINHIAFSQSSITGKFSIKAFLPFWNGSEISLSINDHFIIRETIKNDIFSYTGDVIEPTQGILKIKKGTTIIFLPLFIEPGLIKVRDKGNKVLEVVGTKSNDDYLVITKRFDSLARELKTSNLAAIRTFKKSLAEQYIKANPHSMVSLRLLYDYYYLNNAIDDTLYFSLFHMLDNRLKETAVGKKIGREAIITQTAAIGVTASNLALPDTTNQALPLYEKNQITLIDFWASWCVPCRKSNASLVYLFQKYMAKGFTIVSISLDTNPLLWKTAIKKDNLNWKHLNDLKGWSGEAVKTYGIKNIPTSFLLDQNGIIIAKNLNTETLDLELAKLLQ